MWKYFNELCLLFDNHLVKHSGPRSSVEVTCRPLKKCPGKNVDGLGPATQYIRAEGNGVDFAIAKTVIFQSICTSLLDYFSVVCIAVGNKQHFRLSLGVQLRFQFLPRSDQEADFQSFPSRKRAPGSARSRATSSPYTHLPQWYASIASKLVLLYSSRCYRKDC